MAKKGKRKKRFLEVLFHILQSLFFWPVIMDERVKDLLGHERNLMFESHQT